MAATAAVTDVAVTKFGIMAQIATVSITKPTYLFVSLLKINVLSASVFLFLDSELC